MTTAVLIKLAFVVIVVIAGLAKKAQENAQKQAAARKSAEDALRASMQPSQSGTQLGTQSGTGAGLPKKAGSGLPTAAAVVLGATAKAQRQGQGQGQGPGQGPGPGPGPGLGSGPRGAARTVKSAAKAQPVPPKVIAKSSAPKPKSTKAGGQAVSGPTRGGIPKNSLPKLGAKAPRVSQAPTRPPSIPSNLHRENPHRENLDREEADAMQSRAKVAASVARVQAVEKGVRAAHVGRSQQAAPAGSVAVMRQQPRVAQMAQLRAPQAHALRALIADRTRLREAFLLGEVLGVPGGVGARSQR